MFGHHFGNLGGVFYSNAANKLETDVIYGKAADSVHRNLSVVERTKATNHEYKIISAEPTFFNDWLKIIETGMLK